MTSEMKMHLLWKAEAKNSFNRNKSTVYITHTVEYPHRTLRRNEYSQVPLSLLKMLSNFKDLVSHNLHKMIPLCTLASAHKYTSPH